MKIVEYKGKKAILLKDGKTGVCAYCGKKGELKPYGTGGAYICFKCGMLPENFSDTKKYFKVTLDLLSAEINDEDKPE